MSGVVALTLARSDRLQRGKVSSRRLCAWQRLRPQSFSKARRAPARKASPGSFTRRRRGDTARSSPSTARHCPNNCSSPTFTGAQQSKAGHIELAARGVLFLDEVSEMSLTAQVKILRFVQEREYRRLGGTRLQRADVRIIAASNRDLGEAVERGTFREDLLYRLQVFDILLPPLRDRLSDVPLLAEQFLADCARAMHRRIPGLPDDALEALLAHAWPGNVRELRNVLERAAILSDGDIEGRHLSLRPKMRTLAPSSDPSAVERGTITRVLHETGWH